MSESIRRNGQRIVMHDGFRLVWSAHPWASWTAVDDTRLFHAAAGVADATKTACGLDVFTPLAIGVLNAPGKAMVRPWPHPFDTITIEGDNDTVHDYDLARCRACLAATSGHPAVALGKPA